MKIPDSLLRIPNKDRWQTIHCLIQGSAGTIRTLGRTTGDRRQIILEEHGLTTLGTQELVWYRRDGFLASLINRNKAGELFLQSPEFGALGGGEETIVANLHKTVRQDVIEEALDEIFHREGATLELTVIGRAVREGDLGGGDGTGVNAADQTTVAEGNPENVGSQILERCLSIANRLAVHHPFFLPNLGRDLGEEIRFL